jgi:putative transposase
MRGTIERMFRTCATGLLPRLNGRTFSSVIERGDHPSGERACLDADDLAFALVRWIVDIYHNTPHEGLGGRTPLRQWEMDHEAGNFPLGAAPDARARRLAFGVSLRRVATKAGITVLGLRYNSEVLARLVIDGGAGDVDIRWDAEDIGVIEVLIAGEWREVPAVQDGFAGTNVWTWSAARRALRATTPKRKDWEEDVVRRAVEAIRAMNTERSLQFGLLDKPMDASGVAALEAQLFGGFRVTQTAPKTRACDDGQGVSILPRGPERGGDTGPSSGNDGAGLPPAARPSRDDDVWRFDDKEG